MSGSQGRAPTMPFRRFSEGTHWPDEHSAGYVQDCEFATPIREAISLINDRKPLMASREQIAQLAMTLSDEDREYVADLLERSLPTGDFRPAEIAEAWSHEIHRRIAAYGRGETPAADFGTALDRMREALNAHRAGKDF